MYTGIVAGTAPIVSIEEGDGVRSFTIDLTGFEDGLEIGASVALDGVCMTVVEIDSGQIGFDAIQETLERTTLADRSTGDVLNLCPFQLYLGHPKRGKQKSCVSEKKVCVSNTILFGYKDS